MPLYRDPKQSGSLDRGLIHGLMRAPTTTRIRPEENQFSEALTWALRRVPGLAHQFALLFVAGDTAAEQAIEAAREIGIDTRISAKGASGEMLYPDLSLCGVDRAFQLLVEVKVGSDFHTYPLPDGGTASQPVIYALALAADPSGAGAAVRRVGTLSRDPEEAPTDTHPLRARDVGWAEVRDLLSAAPRVDGIHQVVDELVTAIGTRVLPAPPPAAHVGRLLEWAQGPLLPDVMRFVAAAVAGRTTGATTTGARYAYRGGYVHCLAPDGTALRLWVYISPEGVGYSVPGEPDAVYLEVDPEGEVRANATLQGLFAAGFRRERDLAGYDAWRVWVPVVEVIAGGGAAAQRDLVVEPFTEALAAARLAPSAAGPAAGGS